MGDGNSAMTVSPWPVQNPEIEKLKRRTDELERRAAALEKEIVLLVWAIAGSGRGGGSGAAGVHVRR